MNNIFIGIGDFSFSKNPNDILKAMGLGSCVSIIAYNKKTQFGGLMHIALPDSTVNTAKSKEKPGYFADTAIKILLDNIKKNKQPINQLWIKLVGGANVLKTNTNFDIGKRNALTIKKLLWKNNLGVIKEDIGGTMPRTVQFSISTGQIIINSGQKKWII